MVSIVLFIYFFIALIIAFAIILEFLAIHLIKIVNKRINTEFIYLLKIKFLSFAAGIFLGLIFAMLYTIIYPYPGGGWTNVGIVISIIIFNFLDISATCFLEKASTKIIATSSVVAIYSILLYISAPSIW